MHSDPLALARLRNAETHQLTTYDLDRMKKVPGDRGQTVVLGEVDGRGHIAQLWLTFPGWFWQNWNVDAPISQTILKTLILRIYWDGSDRPAVESPVGDFFGIGLCEVAHFTSKYFGMSSGGFYCRFPMPFHKNFRIEVENRDAEIDTLVYANILYQLVDELPPDLGYFHAQFRSGENAGPETLLVAQAAGRGHYAGCTLSMQAKDPNYLGFLEAPEYAVIDGDWERARIVGSGLEDYFLGGWYFREGPFHGDLHGLPVKDALRSMAAMYRVHEEDALHFRERFRLEFKNPFTDEARPFRYSTTSFLYLNTPNGQSPPLADAGTLLHWYRIRDCDHQSIP